MKQRISEIEDLIAGNEMSAGQVFTQMRQLIPTVPPYDCKKAGHFWREYGSHDQVDEFGRRTGVSYALGGDETQMRLCAICKRRERQVPASWVEIKSP